MVRNPSGQEYLFNNLQTYTPLSFPILCGHPIPKPHSLRQPHLCTRIKPGYRQVGFVRQGRNVTERLQSSTESQRILTALLNYVVVLNIPRIGARKSCIQFIQHLSAREPFSASEVASASPSDRMFSICRNERWTIWMPASPVPSTSSITSGLKELWHLTQPPPLVPTEPR